MSDLPSMLPKKNFLAWLVILNIIFIPPSVFAEGEENTSEFQKGVWEYKHENFEEALDIFKKLREKDPSSPVAAYYLGVTYKKLQNYKEAKPHLEAAASEKPPIPLAVMELIDLCYKKNQINDAKKWILAAKKEKISPAQTAFFEGLVLLKEGEDTASAIKAFREAKSLDGSLAKTADYYIGLAYIKSQKFTEAREVFTSISATEPNTNIAAFAEQYVDMIRTREEARRPFQGNVTTAFQYDSNVSLKPDDESLAPAVGDEGDFRNVYTLDTRYTINPEGLLRAKAGYTLYAAKQFDLGFYDMVNHDLGLEPGIFSKNIAVTFPCGFNVVTVNDKSYLYSLEAGNVNNLKVNDTNMAQAGFIYKNEKYLWAPSGADEDRDSNDYYAHFAWFKFFMGNKGVLQTKYTANYDDTEQNNWEYIGHKFTLASSVPVMERLKVGGSAEFLYERFMKWNEIYHKKRRDGVLSLAAFATYDIMKNLELMLNYNYADDMSNIKIYDYKRHIYSVGLRYKF